MLKCFDTVHPASFSESSGLFPAVICCSSVTIILALILPCEPFSLLPVICTVFSLLIPSSMFLLLFFLAEIRTVARVRWLLNLHTTVPWPYRHKVFNAYDYRVVVFLSKVQRWPNGSLGDSNMIGLTQDAGVSYTTCSAYCYFCI